MTVQPRGIRNCNPLNIDRNATKWQGMADDQSTDPRFVVFKTVQYGIRAGARLLINYQTLYHLNTVRGLIGRWAPAVENNTSAYVTIIAKAVGVDPDAVIDVDTVEVMLPMIRAMILHENGQNPYPDSVILEGLHMAGIADAKPKPLVKQNTFLAQAGTAATVAVAGAAHSVATGAVHYGTAAAAYAPTVKGAADQLSAYTGAPIIQHAVTVLLTVAGGLTLVGIAAQYLKQRTT